MANILYFWISLPSNFLENEMNKFKSIIYRLKFSDITTKLTLLTQKRTVFLNEKKKGNCKAVATNMQP